MGLKDGSNLVSNSIAATLAGFKTSQVLMHLGAEHMETVVENHKQEQRDILKQLFK